MESSDGRTIVCETSSAQTAGSLAVTLKFDESVFELADHFVYTENPTISDITPLSAFYRLTDWPLYQA